MEKEFYIITQNPNIKFILYIEAFPNYFRTDFTYSFQVLSEGSDCSLIYLCGSAGSHTVGLFRMKLGLAANLSWASLWLCAHFSV